MAEEVRTLLSTCNQRFHSQTYRRRSLEIPNTRSWFSDVPENMPLPKTFVSVEHVVHISHDRSHKTNVSNLWYPEIYLYSRTGVQLPAVFIVLLGNHFFFLWTLVFQIFADFPLSGCMSFSYYFCRHLLYHCAWFIYSFISKILFLSMILFSL